MATVTINGKEVVVEEGITIFNAAKQGGVDIPTFCYFANLSSLGSCRMCIVEIEGQRKLQPSCVTPVMHGMVINTESPQVVDARSSMLEFLLANHALDCPICDKAGECELQDMVHKYGPARGSHHNTTKLRQHDRDYAISPVIIKNSNRCVQCMRCTRVCDEVVGAGVLAGKNRGEHQEETSFVRGPLDCTQCGNCIEVCPVGCFMRLPYRYSSRPWDLTSARTVCNYCGTGCQMTIQERDGDVLRSLGKAGEGVNGISLCSRGRFGFDYVNSEERLTTPLVRKDGVLVESTWEEAIGIVNEKFSALNGAAIGGVIGASQTNEELYTFERLLRGTLGSPNLDSTSRWNGEAMKAFISVTGMTEGPNPLLNSFAADTVFVIGNHISDENPISEYAIRGVRDKKGLPIILASSRAMMLDRSASVVLRHGAKKEGPLLESLGGLLRSGTGEDAAGAEKAEADAKSMEDAAMRLKSSEVVSLVVGTEFLRFPEGIAPLKEFVENLRSLGKKVHIVTLLDRSNQRGAWEMGISPSFGPAYGETKPGLSTDGMLEAASGGSLKGMYVVGEDILAQFPDREFAGAALDALDFLVVQDIFLTDTAAKAHVVLPGAAFSEKDGTVTNQEGRVQAVRGLLGPGGGARDDLAIFGDLGSSLDADFGVLDAGGVYEDIKSSNPMYSDLGDGPVAESGTTIKGSGNILSAESKFVTGTSSGDGDFTLITGNHLFGSGTLARNSKAMGDLLPNPEVEISDDDAANLSLESGDTVEVKGRNYTALASVKVGRGSRRGVAFIAENYSGLPVNAFYRRGEGTPRVSIKKVQV